MTDHLELTLANRKSAIPGLQDCLEAFARQNGLPGPVLHAVQLAVEEHLTNIISYGYTDDGRHQIQIRVWCTGTALSVEVEDDGVPFNPLAHPGPDLSILPEDRPIGGLGILMMRRALDDARYRREQGRNVLTLTKHIGVGGTD